MNPSRRAFLRAQVHGSPSLRPPWSISEADFTAGCTRCGACIDACPESILIRGSGGYPEVDFTQGECTFCTRCVAACPEAVFTEPATTPPWAVTAHVGDTCLTRHQVHCRSCAEHCDSDAVGFRWQAYTTPTPIIDAARCTGCGACVSVCPVQAIAIHPLDGHGTQRP